MSGWRYFENGRYTGSWKSKIDGLRCAHCWHEYTEENREEPEQNRLRCCWCTAVVAHYFELPGTHHHREHGDHA